VKVGEGTDRRLGYLMTAGAFAVAFGGGNLGPQGSEFSLQQLSVGWAGLFGAGVVVLGLRGTSRRVDFPILARDPTERDVERAFVALERKAAYSWLASRLLLMAVVLLGFSAAVYSFGGG
jgi:hypothetical protein